jgi:hypothetical protein
MALRPAVIRDQDRIDVRLTGEAEYRIPFTFIEALNEGTLFDRPAQAFLEAARERRLFRKFVNEDHGVITHSDPAGDIRMTVDFSQVIPPTDLNI